MNGSQPNLGRRSFLAAGAAVPAFGASLLAAPARASEGARISDVPDGVFTLGVASGDPAPDGVVLWTRLAPDPVADDGRGGMPDGDVNVQWQVAEDPSFRRIRRTGFERATSAWGHSVHAEVDGLRPDREYWYRFRVGRQISPVGRTRTAPAPGAALASYAFAFTSCNAYFYHFTAFEHMANEDLDLIVHLGDYIYENGWREGERSHLPWNELYTLRDYRIRYGQYKSDPALQAAHASAPWAVAPDDHDVADNWMGDHPGPNSEPDQDPAVFRLRRAAAYQAYYENLPLRRTSMPSGPEMQIYRRLAFGDLLQLNMLDTRRFRSPYPAEVDDRRWDAERTILGLDQEGWLLDGLVNSGQRWNVLGNQVVAMELDHTAGPGESFSKQLWDAYAAGRQRLFDGILERGVDNFVMVTGDAHVSVIGELKEDFSDPDSRTVGAELLGTSISSNGDGADKTPAGTRWLAENPHMKFSNHQRGYQVVRATPEELTCEYKVIPYVSRPGAPLHSRATAHVENGRPGIAGIDDHGAAPTPAA